MLDSEELEMKYLLLCEYKWSINGLVRQDFNKSFFVKNISGSNPNAVHSFV